jgi:histidinol-phosphate aminotransferase
MSPTPVTTNLPTQPASYSWEATDEEVAARYGVAIEDILRFDLNTSPAPPELVAGILAKGAFEAPLSEYPPSDYRRLIEAAARVYGVGTDELLVGAGADEILDLCGKAFLPPGGRAVVPVPTYAMYRVVTEQRGAVADLVPRLGRDAGYALDLDATRAAAAEADVVWLCSPNNPTGLPEPDGAIETLLDVMAVDALAAGREAAVVVLDEAYAEFVGSTLVDLRERHPNLVVIRTASKAYALAGLRVGFAIARPSTIARLAPYRPPGSISTVSVTVVTEALADPAAMEANVARVDAERDRLADALRASGWDVGPTVTNFLLVDFGTPERAAIAATGMLRRGLVPRTFPGGHPLAHALRLTIRDRAGNDRLIAAANELRPELAETKP